MAVIFDIQRSSLNDGPGIRTTIFFKGCPLRCLWCHNPESISPEPELAYYADRCTSCGECVAVCLVSAHSIIEIKHVFDRKSCVQAFDCVQACAYDALKKTGYKMDVREIVSTVLKDKNYYDNSGGGVTLSGGESLFHFSFVFELVQELKKENIHVAIDTCGYVATEMYQKVMPYTDLFLYDIKGTLPLEHIKNTGKDNAIILQNLDYLYHSGAQIELRFPIISGLNDDKEHLKGLALLLNKYPRIKQYHIMPFHNTGIGKYSRNPLSTDKASATNVDIERWKKEIEWMKYQM